MADELVVVGRKWKMSGWLEKQQAEKHHHHYWLQYGVCSGAAPDNGGAKDGAPSAFVGKHWCNQKYHVICHATYLAAFRSVIIRLVSWVVGWLLNASSSSSGSSSSGAGTLLYWPIYQMILLLH